MNKTFVEAEGGEIILMSKEGHYAIIPAKHREEVKGMVNDKCDGCINQYIQTLPKESDYAKDGSLYPNEPIVNAGSSIQLQPVEVTAKAPMYVQWVQGYEKDNPFDIDKYVEERFNNPVGREAIEKINEKEFRNKLRQEGLSQREKEIDEATKMGLMFQRFNPVDKDDIRIADEQFRERYGTSPHRYRYDNDPEYKKHFQQLAKNADEKIRLPESDLRRGDVVPHNAQWMYPNLSGEAKAQATRFSNEVIEAALPLPGLDAMGKIPSLFNAAKKATKMATKADDVLSPIASSVDDVATQASKQPWQMEEMPGLHLKSTMEEGAISKIVEPKTGLVNVEQALAIIGKESGGADKVALIKQGLGETLPKKMDYNEFRKVVQDQLIPLERQFSTQASDYGVARLGYPFPKYSSIQSAIQNGENHILELENQIKNIKSLKKSPDRGKMLNYLSEELKQAKINLDYNKSMLSNLPLENQTLILGNKGKFGRGSSAHGNPKETLGHVHFLRDAETPDVLTVTQIQSDAFQGTHRIMPKVFNKEQQLRSLAGMEDHAKLLKDRVQNAKQLDANTWQLPDGSKVDKSLIESMKKGQDEINLMKKAEIENFTQKQLLDKNHQERYLQELVDYAGKRGDVNKVRVPTSETAAKVQGYTANKTWNIKALENGDEVVLADGTIGKVTDDMFNNSIGITTKDGKKINIDMTDANYGKSKTPPIKSVNNIEVKESAVFSLEDQTILKKYSQQPKLIKKLFGKEPKVVTDSKGNTWYEFDIPKKFKEGKGEIKAFNVVPAAGATGAAIQSNNQNNNTE